MIRKGQAHNIHGHDIRAPTAFATSLFQVAASIPDR
jgi:hypothetical protein